MGVVFWARHARWPGGEDSTRPTPSVDEFMLNCDTQGSGKPYVLPCGFEWRPREVGSNTCG